MLKKFIKDVLPKPVFLYLRKQYNKRKIKKAYLYDFKKYWKFSSTSDLNNKLKLESMIVRESHILEKGLTMPETRLGFGELKIKSLCTNCINFIVRYNKPTVQVEHAISIIKEYLQFHEEKSFKLSEPLRKHIDTLMSLCCSNSIGASSQLKISKDKYFAYSNDSFTKFSNSRKSVRNYSVENIPLEKIRNAISLSLNAPSACNRQTSRVYVYSNSNLIKRILNAQMGANGFGHLSNKLIIITAELGVFSDSQERHQAYIDGGIFAMNLLYSLHSEKIAGCILNCSHTPQKDQILRGLCNIKESEVFIAMISCGIPPNEFYVANSKRYFLEDMTIFN